jgi:hypothetical protein
MTARCETRCIDATVSCGGGLYRRIGCRRRCVGYSRARGQDFRNWCDCLGQMSKPSFPVKPVLAPFLLSRKSLGFIMGTTKTFRLSRQGESESVRLPARTICRGSRISRRLHMPQQRWDELKFYTVQEVARFLGYGEDWVRTEFRRDLGTLEDVFQSGGRHKFLRIRGSAISRVVRRLAQVAA